MNSDNPSAKENPELDPASPRDVELSEEAIYKEKLKDYSISLEKMRDFSTDLFEKQLIYVAGGSIAASVWVIDKFLSGVQDGFIWVLLSWMAWGGTIVVNLLSHARAMMLYNRTLGEIVSENYDKIKADKRGEVIERFNHISLIFYFCGIISFGIFCSKSWKDFNRPKTSENNKIEIIDYNKNKIENKLDSLIKEIHSSKLLIMQPNSDGTRGAVPAPGPAPSNGGSKPKS
ncbi:hypothetical protein [Arachidicoccus terrestris]|uniref:hypothetical protein n=1 Tax=Arachidicoccus terrestris TaxID=2875539 RepID=UPI001CC779CF|nr:hypothetical protein [Arachidicoccus terrestris]UAY55716.1 hypothetical protein K9M52_01395 [Arachidicoccus terrestris]